MRPTLRQLQYLVAIADTGKFGDAARRMNISQPSLSNQVAELEAELGVTLIERGRHGASMTPLGDEVVGKARLILRDVEELKALSRMGDEALNGQISLGVLPTIGPYLLPKVAKELHTAFPSLRLTVREERSIDLDTHLAQGSFDCIISRPEDHPLMKGMKLFEEDLFVCAADEDELSTSTAPVELSALRGRTVLSLGTGHGLTTVTEEIAKKAGAFVSADYVGTSLDALRQTAIMGGGVALLPSLYTVAEARRDPEFRVRKLRNDDAVRTISLLWRETSPLARQFSKLGDIMKKTAFLTLNAKDDGSG